MKNIELKISIDNFKKIIPILRKIGAGYDGKLHQVDIYYNYKDGRLKLRNTNNKDFELIFYQRPNKCNAKISNYQILYIEPKKFKDFKSNLKNKLGEKVVVKKERNLWIYKNTRIHLDRVERLGKFLELETVVKKNFKQAQKEYNEIIKRLNLSKYKKWDKSYSDLLLSKVN